MTREDSAAAAALAQSVNAFACDLYGRVGEAEGNLAVSPLSVSAALGITYAGARGVTREEMRRALHFGPDDARINAGYRSLFAQLDERAKAGGAAWTLANSMWVQQGTQLQPGFVQTTRESLRAGLDTLDFRGAPEAAREAINRWVEKKTQDRIRNLFPPGSIKIRTRLVLANAIYFKGRWATQFDAGGTRPRPFHVRAGVDKTTPMMSIVHRYRFARIRGAQVVELPYAGEQLAMVIVLPDRIGGLRALEERLDADSLHTWLSALREQEVAIDLPRFTATSRLELSPALAALGMRSAFDPQVADFSGMTGTRDLAVSVVAHQAYVEVNEEGTEAAAATGVGLTISAIPVAEQFVADHPFLYLIRDRASGAILFLGRVTDPTL